MQTLTKKLMQLSRRDQRWILQQLTKDQIKRLIQNDLHKNDLEEDIALPEECFFLAKKSPFFIAIILHHGNFPWQKKFLEQYNLTESVYPLLKLSSNLKISSRQVLWEEWQKTFNICAAKRIT